MNGWEVFPRDPDTLKRQGEVEFRKLDLNMTWLGGSAFVLRCHHDDAALLPVGGGVIVALDGVTVVSGEVTERTRTVTASDDEVVIAGIDDTARLGRHIVYPDPSLPADDDLQPGYGVRTGDAETVIGGYVEDNAGPSALDTETPSRRIPGLVVAASQARGETVTGRGRWNNLLEFCATLAERGEIGFRAVQKLGESPAITFEAVIPAQRAGARLDIDGLHGSGALKGWTYSVRAPQANVAIAGGRGELADRLIRQDTVDDGFGRIETWLDRNNAGEDGDLAGQTAALDDEIADALLEGQAAVDLDLEPFDTDAVRWGRDYNLGDWVRVRVEGEWQWRQVRGLEIRVDVSGSQVGPKLGDPSRSQLVRLFSRLDGLERKVAEKGRA